MANTAGTVYNDRLHTTASQKGPGSLYGNYEYVTFITINIPFNQIKGIENCTRIRTKLKLNANGYNLSNYNFGSLYITIYQYGKRSSVAGARFMPTNPGVVSSTTEFTTNITKFADQGSWDRLDQSGNITITINAYRSYSTSSDELYRMNFENLDIYEIKFLK